MVAKTIENAFLFAYSNKDLQIWIVHCVREALRYVRKKILFPTRKAAYNLYKAKDGEEFLNRLYRFKRFYQDKEPKFFKLL